MRYEVTEGGETFQVEVHEAGPGLYDVRVDGAAPVRVDAHASRGSMYSVLIGSRQYEGSIEHGENGTLDVHVGTSLFEFQAVDARRALLRGRPAGAASGRQVLVAQMPGRIVKIHVKPGDEVKPDQPVLVIEAMKMENELRSAASGIVREVSVAQGAAVEMNAQLVVIEPLP
ncbi:MAG TPA: biotin/lipoyl-containing protein [Burkholderiales bacterium]|nr:biotin/lipoyl-containing protein [Burkholderiales bacterium]